MLLLSLLRLGRGAVSSASFGANYIKFDNCNGIKLNEILLFGRGAGGPPPQRRRTKRENTAPPSEGRESSFTQQLRSVGGERAPSPEEKREGSPNQEEKTAHTPRARVSMPMLPLALGSRGVELEWREHYNL